MTWVLNNLAAELANRVEVCVGRDARVASTRERVLDVFDDLNVPVGVVGKGPMNLGQCPRLCQVDIAVRERRLVNVEFAAWSPVFAVGFQQGSQMPITVERVSHGSELPVD